jgi:ABC-type lipoprotein release transport system permease subunit
VSTGILTGALAIGDSVRHSLRRQAEARLGTTELALATANRFFRDELAEELATRLNTKVAPVLQVRGLMADSSDTKRVNIVQVLGVDRRFFEVGPGKDPSASDSSGGIIVNQKLAARLGARAGDEVLLRIEKPSMMSRDIPIAPDSDLTVASRLVIKAVAGRSEFGSFSLQANQIAPLNAFVPIEWLQDKLDCAAQANMLLVTANPPHGWRTSPKDNVTLEKANIAINECWKLADAGLELRRLDEQHVLELRSRRIFIDEVVADAAMKAADGAVGVLTYFVNELRLVSPATCGQGLAPGTEPALSLSKGPGANRSTPYSMVTAMSSGPGSPVPMDMLDGEILVNQWLADDLEAKVGDSIELSYFVIGSARNRKQQIATLRVRQILPMEHPALDPELMPEFPGLAKVDNCRDWDRGIPIDLNRIRKRDEDYWDRYRGTPKAFITLAAGQKLWANRFGSLTAVRYPFDRLRAGPLAGNSAQAITEKLTGSVDPASVGLFFQPVRRLGLEAANKATDFSQLFLGLSMFLIVAALILMALIFVFGVQSRSEQIGMLRAVGFPPRLVRRLLLAEGGTLAALGAIVGTAVGLLYTKAMIYGLATGWQDAVGGSTIEFYAKPLTLIVGAAVGTTVSMIAMSLAARKQSSLQARELLAGNLQWQFLSSVKRKAKNVKLWNSTALSFKFFLLSFWQIWVIVLCSIASGVIVFSVRGSNSTAVSAAFFGAGALLLIGGIALTAALLKIIASDWKKAAASLSGLALRNSTRRSGRSLAVVGLLACGTFLVIAVGANRQNPLARAEARDSGTGGFALYGESAVPVLYDLNTESARRSVGLDPNELQGVGIVQLRVHDGDDASCLNLNRAQRPRLLGVNPEQLQQRGAFSFREIVDHKTGRASLDVDEARNESRHRVTRLDEDILTRDRNTGQGWHLLNSLADEDVVPAVGDYPTIVWSLGKSVGDELEYVDEMGRKFRLRLVGMLKNSILQGSLLISENNFTQRFASEEGYRAFLIDAPPGGPRHSDGGVNRLAPQLGPREAGTLAGFSERLSARLKDFGLELTPARDRLAEFSAVENTYLSIFGLLGGLGLILGTVGLALVVLRNMLDRRGELAMLRAVGFSKANVGRMVFYEHWLLCLWGLTCGVTAALVAVRPASAHQSASAGRLSADGGASPTLLLIVAAIALSSLVWIRLATAFAMSGNMLDALRSE